MTRAKRRPASLESERARTRTTARSARLARIGARAAFFFAFVMGTLALSAAGCGADNGVVGGVCAPGYTECSAYCVNLNIDPLNCGVCGNPCSGGEACSGGTCGSGLDATTTDGDAPDGTVDVGDNELDGRPRCDASNPCRTECRPPPGVSCTDSGGPEGGEAGEGGGPGPDSGDAEAGTGPDGSNPEGGPITDAGDGGGDGDSGEAGDPDACTPPYNTTSRCGACDVRCQPLEVCALNAGGLFTCQPKCAVPLSNCFGTCVNLLRDPFNCGTCGNVCPSRICLLGTCQGEVAGNVIVIGHDYLKSAGNTQQVKLLDNAVFVNNTSTLRILSYERYADPAEVAQVKALLVGYASTHGVALTITPLVLNDDISKLTVKLEDVLCVYDQSKAPAGTLAAIGAQWATRLATFTIGGGIVLTLDGGQGTHEMPAFTTAAGLLSMNASTPLLPGAAVRVVATNDAVSRGLVNQYAAEVNSVRFSTSEAQSSKTIFVVTEPSSGQPVVVHKIVN